MKNIAITITKGGSVVSSRTSSSADIVLMNHSKAFRHDIETGKGDYIQVSLLDNMKELASISGNYDINDFEHYDRKIANLCKKI